MVRCRAALKIVPRLTQGRGSSQFDRIRRCFCTGLGVAPKALIVGGGGASVAVCGRTTPVVREEAAEGWNFERRAAQVGLRYTWRL